MFYRTPNSEGSVKSFEIEQVQSILISKDEEIYSLNNRLVKQEEEKDLEIQHLKMQLLERAQEKEKLIEDFRASFRSNNDKYCENRDFLIHQYDSIIKSKNELWMKRVELINKNKENNGRNNLINCTSFKDEKCSPIKTAFKDATTSPLCIASEKQFFQIAHFCFPNQIHNKKPHIPKPKQLQKIASVIFSPISHRTRKASRDMH